MAKPTKKADQYNDPSHNYFDYWKGRGYEDAAEKIALTKLLGRKHFKHAADIGGGFGRLCIFLQQYAEKVTLAEPSKKQLDLAEVFLRDYPDIERKLTQADHLDFHDGELDLITMIRVMHHLPNPAKEFSEISRVLDADGRLILEFANYAHARNRLKHYIKGKRLPKQPVDIRTNKNKDVIPFVNHNPKTVLKQLSEAGLKVEKTLSVSNLRSPGLKKVFPNSAMLALEKVMQRPLAKTYFGPSTFLLIKKAK